MNRLRHLAIESYRLATKPLRDCTTARLRKEGQIPLSVLFYHRVANEHPNDWTISRKSFADHLDWLEDNTELVSLEAIQARMVRGHNEAHCAHITFDDGYAENCDFAIPELLSRNIPCTYFVSLDFIQTGRAFPHDAAAGRPLPPNSIDQLREMATAGIEIGAHTRNHPDLGKVTDAGTLYDEVITATRELSDLIGQPIRYFAFPFGLQRILTLMQPTYCEMREFEEFVPHSAATTLPVRIHSTFDGFMATRKSAV